MKELLNGLAAQLRGPATGTAVSTQDRIESARITSTKLKALKPRQEESAKNSAIDRLLTRAAKLYKEFKEQKTSPAASLLERLDRI